MDVDHQGAEKPQNESASDHPCSKTEENITTSEGPSSIVENSQAAFEVPVPNGDVSNEPVIEDTLTKDNTPTEVDKEKPSENLCDKDSKSVEEEESATCQGNADDTPNELDNSDKISGEKQTETSSQPHDNSEAAPEQSEENNSVLLDSKNSLQESSASGFKEDSAELKPEENLTNAESEMDCMSVVVEEKVQEMPDKNAVKEVEKSESESKGEKMEVDTSVIGETGKPGETTPKTTSPVLMNKPVEQVRRRAKMSMSPNKSAVITGSTQKITIRPHGARKSLHSGSAFDLEARAKRKASQDAAKEKECAELSSKPNPETIVEDVEMENCPVEVMNSSSPSHKTTIDIDAEISFVVDTEDEDAVNSSIDEHYGNDTGEPHGNNTRTALASVKDSDMTCDIGDSTQTSMESPQKQFGSAQEPKSAPSSTKSTPSKGIPKARKSCQPLPKTDNKQSNKEKAKQQVKSMNFTPIANMTLHLKEIEKSLGIKGQTLAEIDAKTLDKLILEKAQMSKKKLKLKRKAANLNSEGQPGNVKGKIKAEDSPLPEGDVPVPPAKLAKQADAQQSLVTEGGPAVETMQPVARPGAKKKKVPTATLR